MLTVDIRYCWTTASSCNSSLSRQCSGGNWCCYNFDTCSSTDEKPCIQDQVANPLVNIDPSVARQIASQAILSSVSGYMLSVPTALGISISTVSPTASQDTSITTPTATRGSTTTSTREMISSQRPQSSPTPNSPSSSGLAGAAIGGIVAGVVAILIILGITVLLMRKRKGSAAKRSVTDPQVSWNVESKPELHGHSKLPKLHELETREIHELPTHTRASGPTELPTADTHLNAAQIRIAAQDPSDSTGLDLEQQRGN